MHSEVYSSHSSNDSVCKPKPSNIARLNYKVTDSFSVKLSNYTMLPGILGPTGILKKTVIVVPRFEGDPKSLSVLDKVQQKCMKAGFAASPSIGGEGWAGNQSVCPLSGTLACYRDIVNKESETKRLSLKLLQSIIKRSEECTTVSIEKLGEFTSVTKSQHIRWRGRNENGRGDGIG